MEHENVDSIYGQKMSVNLPNPVPLSIDDFCFYIFILRGGVQGQKLWKYNFEIRGGPKGPQ